jgi:hypothetical protein
VNRRFSATYPHAITVVVLKENAVTVPRIKVFGEVTAFFSGKFPMISDGPVQAVRVTETHDISASRIGELRVALIQRVAAPALGVGDVAHAQRGDRMEGRPGPRPHCEVNGPS